MNRSIYFLTGTTGFSLQMVSALGLLNLDDSEFNRNLAHIIIFSQYLTQPRLVFPGKYNHCCFVFYQTLL